MCSREQKELMQSKRKRQKRMTEAGVDDVIVLTYDVTACVCVHFHLCVIKCLRRRRREC